MPSAVNCSDPGTPTNGQHSLSSTTYNSVVTYACDVGYTLWSQWMKRSQIILEADLLFILADIALKFYFYVGTTYYSCATECPLLYIH